MAAVATSALWLRSRTPSPSLLSPPLVPPTTWASLRSSSGRQSAATGTCRDSQAVDVFLPLLPEVAVRDVRLEDYWEVADTHCSCFLPNFRFPLNLLLRINRFVGLLLGFSAPPGSMKACLVAVTSGSVNDNLVNEDLKRRGFEGKFCSSRGYVAGILTIDTIADFLPRKGPLQERRTGVAYISNLAVRNADRRKGIAKKLIVDAEARAQSWGCRFVALHCDANNLAAISLYRSQGYKCIQVPENARWPEPRTLRSTQFSFMMKLIKCDAIADSRGWVL